MRMLSMVAVIKNRTNNHSYTVKQCSGQNLSDSSRWYPILFFNLFFFNLFSIIFKVLISILFMYDLWVSGFLEEMYH